MLGSLSSTSKGLAERKQQGAAKRGPGIGGRSRVPSMVTGRLGSLVVKHHSVRGSLSRHVTFANLILGFVVASIVLQCAEAKVLDFESQEGKPCICNSTFYRFCPKAQDCLENNVPDASPSTRAPFDARDTYSSSEDHDDFDPDHVSDPWQLPPQVNDLNENSWLRGRSDQFRLDSVGRAERHRKVYLKPIDHSDGPMVHGINIRIPVKVPTIKEPHIPEPKPIFKMKKYVTYERMPEIVQVPVVKTIIKPVGVSPDQIIQDDSTGPLAL